MTVTVEVIEKKSLNLLDAMENMGLIHVLPSVPQETDKPAREGKSFVERMRGIHAGIPGASVEDFLADCREDKEHELAIEKRQEEECERRRAEAELSS